MIDLFEKIKLLKQSTIFEHVDTDNLRFIAGFLEEDIALAGEKLFEINDFGKDMFIITSGKIGISISNKQGEYIVTLGAGECFGEMNLLDGFPRSATAFVVEDCHLLSLNKNNLQGLIHSYPEISFGIMRSLSLRLRKSDEKKN